MGRDAVGAGEPPDGRRSRSDRSGVPESIEAPTTENPSPETQSRIFLASAIVDKYGVINCAGAATECLLMSHPGQLEGTTIKHLLPGLPIDPETPDENLAIAEAWEKEARWRRLAGRSAKGDTFALEVIMKSLRMDHDQFILLGMRPVADDAHAAREAKELTRMIEAHRAKADPVLVIDVDGIIVAVNPACEQATGYAQAEVVGQPVGLLKPDFHNPDFCRQMCDSVLAGNERRALIANRTSSGAIDHEDTLIRPFVNAAGVATHLVLTSSRPSEPLQSTLMRLQHEIFHDHLTGLPNRSLFMDRLAQSIAGASRRDEKFAIVFIDLDGFKQINDTHGHAGGDTILRATALYLMASVREEDTAARIGGDEFALILRDTHQRQDVEWVVTKILTALPDGASFDDQRVPIRASIGVSIYPDDGTVGDLLMQHADAAMYAAKAAGGHCMRFFGALSAPVSTQTEQDDGTADSGDGQGTLSIRRRKV
ncbi:MAG: diguanylate cyclase [Propionivibrio sp.]